MTTYAEWAATHPQAAADLQALLGAAPWPADSNTDGKSEAWAQQRARFNGAKHGAVLWRNNVGATPARCPDCGAKQRPVRYGLANDSHKLNEVIKSADLIGGIPRLITPDMVGQTLAQLAAVETKRPGWAFTSTKHEQAQAAFLALVVSMGGYATFSTGELDL